MKNVKLICLLALVTFSAPAFSAATASLQEPADECIVNPAAIVAPKVHPKKKYVHLHTTPQTKARTHALAALRTHGKLPVAINICPPTPAVTKITQATAMSVCRVALGRSAIMTPAETQALLVAAGYNSSPASLKPAMARAMLAHPDVAPAIYAYSLQQVDPNNKEAIYQLSQEAYLDAPGQAAGLAYGAIAANPNKTEVITQSLLANATPQDSQAIRQCAVDANPNIRTGAFVPALAPEFSAVGQNDIRNNVNNAVGVQTLVPGLEQREKDDLAT